MAIKCILNYFTRRKLQGPQILQEGTKERRAVPPGLEEVFILTLWGEVEANIRAKAKKFTGMKMCKDL